MGRPGSDRPTALWRDRFGGTHTEGTFPAHGSDPKADRVPGAIELAWPGASSAERAVLSMAALATANPAITSDPTDSALGLWTWTVQSAEARAVLLWTNPVFDHENVPAHEFERLADSDLWTLTVRLPLTLRASYRVAVWTSDDAPTWRTAEGRRPRILAAIAAGTLDERGREMLRGSGNEPSSVASGPQAPHEPWAGVIVPDDRRGALHEVALPDAPNERAWVYRPAGEVTDTPLLVLFDGQVWWQGLELPAILDAAIAAGLLPPIHVAFLDSQEFAFRWENLGVPTGQVDTVLDHLLPVVRRDFAVSADGAHTLISGQSLGGIAALWTLALGEGQVQHAIAQSPSLWRFPIAEVLAAQPEWKSVLLQAGSFEGHMVVDSTALAETLNADPRLAQRTVRCEPQVAGHDWAVWRPNLVNALIQHFAER